MKEEISKELSRVPRTLGEMYNSEMLDQFYHVGGSILSDILIFAASEQMQNLFGDAWFDMNSFCETMGYNRTRLQRKLTDEQITEFFGNLKPVYITEGNGKMIEHPIENTFEAALYRLGSANISLAYTQNGETKFKFVKLLDSFDIKDSFDSKKKTKRIYNVHMSKEIVDTLFTEYNLLELKDYRRIPNRKGYRKFYLYLAKMIFLIKYRKEQGQEPCFTATVNQLADLFDISIQTNADRKKKVNSTLRSINKTLENTNFQYEFIKGEHDKWPYTVKFSFSDEVLAYFDEKLKAVINSQFYDQMKTAYLNKIGIPVPKHYQYANELKSKGSKLYDDFINWFHSKEDEELKLKTYETLTFEILKGKSQDGNLHANF